MEVFTDIDIKNLLLGVKFQCPASNGTSSESCVAVTSETAQRLVALYSVMVALIFVFCWKLVSVIVMMFSGSLDLPMRRRLDPQKALDASDYDAILWGIAFVGFWNSREPLEATLFISGFLFRLLRRSLDKKFRARWLAVGLLLLAVVWLSGSYIASVFVAGKLIAGNIAPADPNRVFVPTPGLKAESDKMRLQALRAPATLRSLGSAEAASEHHTIRDHFSLEAHLESGDSPQYFSYSYTVGAGDMGLQKWHDLRQEVSGRCDVDSSWLWKSIPEQDVDVYRPWGLENKTVKVVIDGERKTAPSATAIPFPYAKKDFLIDQAAENRYGIIVRSSHRASHRPGTDPWYKTESFVALENETDARIPDPAGNQVMGGRPALSCTQKDVWWYNGTQFKNVYELTNRSNINFPDGWATQLQLDFFDPRIIDMVNSAGSSSLASSSTFVGERFDAQSSKIKTDMTRLFTATWISTAHTFRNMLMVGDNTQDIPNAAHKGTEQPQDGVGLFVASTPQVGTLRYSVLLSIPILLGVLAFMLSLLECVFKYLPWYRNMHFSEGAYLYAVTQNPDLCGQQEIEPPSDNKIRLGHVIERCLEEASKLS